MTRGAAPAVLERALERADAGILCVQPEQGRASAPRMAIVSVVETPRRFATPTMVGVDAPQIMQPGHAPPDLPAGSTS